MNSRRFTRRFVMHATHTPERVFPLLCPVREYEWIETWKCDILYSRSGFAELDCVFKTRNGETEDLWTISRYEPSELVEFVVVSVSRIMRYRFELRPEGDGATRIEISQHATSLDPENRNADDPQFEVHMRTLEVMLNYFLDTGEKISEAKARVLGSAKTS